MIPTDCEQFLDVRLPVILFQCEVEDGLVAGLPSVGLLQGEVHADGEVDGVDEALDIVVVKGLLQLVLYETISNNLAKSTC